MDATAITITITAGGVVAAAGVWLAARYRARRHAADLTAGSRSEEDAAANRSSGRRVLPPTDDGTA
jgi:hypothetical protein